VTRWKRFRDLVMAQLGSTVVHSEAAKKGWEKKWYPVATPITSKREELSCAVTLRYRAGWEGAGWPAASQLTAPAPPKWSWQELILSPDASWMNQHQPCVAVGVGFDHLPDWSEEAVDWNQLLQASDQRGAWHRFTDREKIFRVLIARPLAEVMSMDETLDAQAEAVVRWALSALDSLVEIDSRPGI
jgi:hypothetical protein